MTDLVTIGKPLYAALLEAEEAANRALAAMAVLQTQTAQASAESGLGGEIPAYVRTAQESLARSAAVTKIVHRRLEAIALRAGVEPSAIGFDAKALAVCDRIVA